MSSHFPSAERLSIAVPEAFVALVSSVADIAIVADREGRITDVFWNIEDAGTFDRTHWLGRHIEEVVTEESRPKLRQLLEGALAGNEDQRWREVNHVIDRLGEIPIRYKAVLADDFVIFLGREMRAVASLQSQLVDAQRALDEDYGRLRQLETRYRVLFQTSSEPLLIVNPNDRKVREANAAAGRLFGQDPQELAGAVFDALFPQDERSGIVRLIDSVVASGQSASATVRLNDEAPGVEVRANVFRASDSLMMLCRLRAINAGSAEEPAVDRMLVGMVGRIPDAVVLTDPDARILWCNDAFLGLAEIVLPSQVRNEPLARFLGRPGVDLDVIVANAREHGRLRAFTTILRGAFGSTTRVEISVTSMPETSPPVIGFLMRDVSRHDQLPVRPSNGTAEGTTDGLMHLVGTVPLKELVRASTEEIEKMCIETALQMTGNNRASAAEMLGLSRQSLYVKLRRFGLMAPGDRD